MSTLVDILQEFNVPYREAHQHHHVTHGWVGIDCPSCSPNSGSYKLGLNLKGNYASCWSCGPVQILRALSELTGVSEGRLRGMLDLIPHGRKHDGEKPRGKLIIPPHVGDFAPIHEQYLRERGFDPWEIAHVWGVRGISQSNYLKWRLFIPIHFQGECVSWTTRTVSKCKKVPRYVSAAPHEEKINHKELLYGEDMVKHSVIVCEGPADAWRIGPGAVATFGLTYTPAQVLKISRFPLRVICFDSDRAAQKRADTLCNELAVFPGKTFRMETAWKDPGSIDDQEFVQRIREEFLS